MFDHFGPGFSLLGFPGAAEACMRCAEQDANAEMKTARTENSVSVVRWLRNSLPQPTYKLAAGFTTRVDRWTETETERSARYSGP